MVTEMLLLVNAMLEWVSESQPKETLMSGTTFDCRESECHLKVILHVKSTASFSATDVGSGTGWQTGFRSERSHDTSNNADLQTVYDKQHYVCNEKSTRVHTAFLHSYWKAKIRPSTKSKHVHRRPKRKRVWSVTKHKTGKMAPSAGACMLVCDAFNVLSCSRCFRPSTTWF